MAAYRALVTVKHAGKWHPPGAALPAMTAHEAAALRGRVEVIPDPVMPPAEPAAPTGGEGAPPAADVPPVEQVVTGIESGPHLPATGPAVEVEGPGVDLGPSPDEGRVAEIARSIDVLDEADFAASGRPKMGPLSDALGYRPTPAEVDAAIALRAEMIDAG